MFNFKNDQKVDTNSDSSSITYKLEIPETKDIILLVSTILGESADLASVQKMCRDFVVPNI